jgi:hypothetical protein
VQSTGFYCGQRKAGGNGRQWLDAAPASGHDCALIFGADAQNLLKP